MHQKISRLTDSGQIAWLYLRYQFITKGLTSLVIFPVFFILTNLLIQSTGRTSISSGDYLGFLFSFQGLGLLFLTLLLIILLIGTDINAFIIMSAMIHQGKLKMTVPHILWAGFRSLKSFFRPAGVLVILYVALVVPLVGIGFTISPTANFQLPNFITTVIFSNWLYGFSYLLLLAFLAVISLRYIFLFHFILLFNLPIGQALKKSSNLIRTHWRDFVRNFILKMLLSLVKIFLPILILAILLLLPSSFSQTLPTPLRIWTIFSVSIISELFALATLMIVPLSASRLTELFYRYQEDELIESSDDSSIISSARFKIPLRFNFYTDLIVAGAVFILLFFNLHLAIDTGQNFEQFFSSRHTPFLVAHRGGGDLAAENSLAGLISAQNMGIKWSEIDVQRTKDNKYVINHDPTFKRLANLNQKVSDLTLAEIQKLQLVDHFDIKRPSQPVAALIDFLKTADRKTHLLIELKGHTADRQMVDDIAHLITEYQLQNSTVIIALDYELINYAKTKYPELQTGLIYFFSIGEIAQISSDWLVMEEGEATADRLSQARAAGKKTLVWTVNHPDALRKFINSEVNGIITDHLVLAKQEITRRANRTDLQLILDKFWHQSFY